MDVNRNVRNSGTPAHNPTRSSRSSRIPSSTILAKLKATLGDPFTESSGAWMRRDARGESGDNLLLSGQFWTVGEVAHDYLLRNLLSKFCDPNDKKGATERARKAVAKFMKAEDMCRLTNIRMQSAFKPVFQGRFDAGSVLYTAQRKIGELLRMCDCTQKCGCIESLCNPLCDFGPGGTTSRPRREGDKSLKFVGDNECTSGNLALALASINARPLWLKCLLEEGASIVINDRDKLVTVPKNSEIDRVICSQPDLNVFIQKGYGSMLRRRLKKVGIDLDDQSVNQDMARVGSLFENLATIDLSMASDTLSIEVVRQLLPCDWYSALEQSRVPETVLPCGTIHKYHKFSAMGNGFTFELETLIFWALTKACCELMQLKDQRVVVYGDDIVCPVEAVPLVRDVLEYCGFAFNNDKSFWDSPFRESCGKHYFEGADVTPFFVRRPIDSVEELFLLYNNIWRWMWRIGKQLPKLLRDRMWGLLDLLKTYVPARFKECRIPDGFGDGGLVGTFDFVRPRLAPHGLDGFVVKALSRVPEKSQHSHCGWLLKFLHQAEMRRSVSVGDLGAISTLAPNTGVFRNRITEMFLPRSALS